MAGTPAENKARVVVSTEWALFTIGLLGLVIFFAVFSKDFRRHDFKKKRDSEIDMEKLYIGIVVGSILITLGLNLLLTIGVYRKRRIACSVWYAINLISTIAAAIYLLLCIGGLFAGTSTLGAIGLTTIVFTYRFFCGKYVGKYIEELRILQSDTPGELRLAFKHHSNQNMERLDDKLPNV